MMKRVAVVGGGISGLAAAYYLQKKDPSIEILIFEAAPRAGGIIETITHGQALMECGPDAFLSEKPWAADLCRELGLETQIISTNPEFRRSFILSQGKLKAIPAGFYLMAPRSFKAWWHLPGMSWMGKLRMLADLFLPAGDAGDESLESFVLRRFGREALNKLAQPMIAGIYTSRPESLSLLATFPKFKEMERQQGSVIRGLAQARATKAASGPRYSLFSTLRNGMETLTKELQIRFAEKIHLAESAESLTKGEGWKIRTAKNNYAVDAVCLAIPSYQSARILRECCPELSAKLATIRFESVATISFLFERKNISHPLDGFGFVVPALEKRSLIGCSFSHRKFEGRVVNAEQVLLRAFVGGAYGQDVFSKTDVEMTELILKDLREILGISGSPLKTFLRRYPRGMPQYEVGHLERVQAIFETTRKEPGIFLTGNSYEGTGIPDCIHHAMRTAENISQFLSTFRVS